MNWNYGIAITGIPWDMWGALVAKGPDELSFYIQCDRAEDGLAYVVNWATKNLKSRKEV